MSFVQEGDIPAQLQGAIVAESVLNKNAQNSVDICVKVATEDGTQSDYWRANLSASYTQVSNRSGWTNSQVTYEKICALGYQGPNFSEWPNNPQLDWNGVANGLAALSGPTVAHCAKNAKGYINVKWLGGGGNVPVALDANTLMNMAGQMNGGQPPQQQPQQQPVQPMQTQQPMQQPQGQQPPQQPGGFQQQPQQGQPGGFSS